MKTLKRIWNWFDIFLTSDFDVSWSMYISGFDPYKDIPPVCRICKKNDIVSNWVSKIGKDSLCEDCASYRQRILQFFIENPTPDFSSKVMINYFTKMTKGHLSIPEKSVLKNLLYLTREKKLVRHILPGTKVFSYRLNEATKLLMKQTFITKSIIMKTLKRIWNRFWNWLFPEPKIPTHHTFNKEVLKKRLEEIRKNPIIPSEAYKKIRAEREAYGVQAVCRVCGWNEDVGCSWYPSNAKDVQEKWYSKFGKKSLCTHPKCVSYRNRIFQFFLEHPAPDYPSDWLVDFFGVSVLDLPKIPTKGVLKNLLYLTREKKLIRHILPGTKIYSYRLNEATKLLMKQAFISLNL